MYFRWGNNLSSPNNLLEVNDGCAEWNVLTTALCTIFLRPKCRQNFILFLFWSVHLYKWVPWIWITLVSSMESRINTKTQIQTRILQLLPTLIYAASKSLNPLQTFIYQTRSLWFALISASFTFSTHCPSKPQLAVLTVQTLTQNK